MSSDHAQLHAYLLSAIDEIRSSLGSANIPRFDLTIRAGGRTLGSPEILIEYEIGDYSNHVTGSTLAATITEYLRRKGWQETNNPTYLPPTSDNIPF